MPGDNVLLPKNEDGKKILYIENSNGKSPGFSLSDPIHKVAKRLNCYKLQYNVDG